MKKLQAFAITCLLLFTGCSNSKSPVLISNEPGRHDHVIEVESENRHFIVYVPALAQGEVAAPVVFMFHGSSGDGEKFFNISGWREKADEVGLIAVFPSSLQYCFHEDVNTDGDFDDPGETKNSTKWDAGAIGDGRVPLCTAEEIAELPATVREKSDHPARDDVRFIEAILDFLSDAYVIDDRRVYASGFSNGGSMTSRLARDLPNRFAAIAAASGFLQVDAVPTTPAVPMFLSLGASDDGFLSKLGVEEMPLDETFLAFDNVDELLGNYQSMLQIQDSYTMDETVIGQRQIVRFTYSQSSAGQENELIFMLMEGVEHQYPNGTNVPLVMTEILWPFFSQYSLP